MSCQSPERIVEKLQSGAIVWQGSARLLLEALQCAWKWWVFLETVWKKQCLRTLGDASCVEGVKFLVAFKDMGDGWVPKVCNCNTFRAHPGGPPRKPQNRQVFKRKTIVLESHSVAIIF